MPPPGFRPFRWPQADWDDIGDATLDPGLEFVARSSARIMEERPSPPPLMPLSPITAEDSQDSIMVQIGSPISELYTPTGLDRIRSVNRRRPRRPMKMLTKCEKPAPAEDFLFRDILCDPATITSRSLSESTGNKDRGRVPRWRLAREGPFPNERSQASLQVQYALALHGTASKILQKTIGGGPYPRAEVAAAAQGPRARRVSVHMEVLGLWRPSMDPVQFETPQCKTSSCDVLNGL